MRAFIPNLEDCLSTRFLYHNLPAKSDVHDEMDEAMAEAFNDVYTHYRGQLTEIWKELPRFIALTQPTRTGLHLLHDDADLGHV